MDPLLQSKSIQQIVEAWEGLDETHHEMESERVRSALTDLSGSFNDAGFKDKKQAAVKRHSWVVQYFSEAIAEAPETAWQSVLAIWKRIPRDRLDKVAYLAAGPVEDLLGAHGQQVLPWFERALADDPEITLLLRGVWRGQMDSATWQRLNALHGNSDPL